MKSEFGKMRHATAPLAKHIRGAQTQTGALEEWLRHIRDAKRMRQNRYERERGASRGSSRHSDDDDEEACPGSCPAQNESKISLALAPASEFCPGVATRRIAPSDYNVPPFLAYVPTADCSNESPPIT